METEKDALGELKVKVQGRTNLLQAIKDLIAWLNARVNDTDDIEEIRAITAELVAQDTDIAQFIADNTPAAPVANETGPAPVVDGDTLPPAEPTEPVS